MDYDERAAEKLERVYTGRDVVRQRAHTLDILALQPGERVLDVGSGPGFLAHDMATAVGPTGRVLGIDISEPLVARSKSRNSHQHLSYALADATAIPEPGSSFDVVVSTQVAEYIEDIKSFCTECFRVLKPGGRAVHIATDWSSLAFYSRDTARMDRIMKAFESHCADSRLPQTFGAKLSAAGFQIDRVSAFPIVNTDWSTENYSSTMMEFVKSYLVGAGTVRSDELDDWIDEQKMLAANGEYYFMTTRIVFETRKQHETLA